MGKEARVRAGLGKKGEREREDKRERESRDLKQNSRDLFARWKG